MSFDKDIKDGNMSVGDYLQHRESLRIRKEIEDGVQPLKKDAKGKQAQEDTSVPKSEASEKTNETLSRRERRDARREAMMNGNYSALEILRADQEMMQTIRDSYEDCCGKDF